MGSKGRVVVGLTVVAAMILGIVLAPALVTADDGGNVLLVDRSKITPELRAEWRANKGNRDYVPSASVTTRIGSARAPTDPMIQYDDGTAAQRSGTLGYTIGNQFNVDANNTPIDPAHTVSTIQFSMAGLFGTAAYVSFYGPVAGTSAPSLTSALLTGLALGMNTVVFTPPMTGNSASFLAGIFNSSYATCTGTALGSTCDGVALSNGQNGLGFHAMEINDGVGTDFATRTNQNAIFRVRGANLPVELMAVTVE